MELIRIKNVTKQYRNGVTAIYDLDLKIKKGDFVFIIGGTGCGKSTLIKMLYREEKPDPQQRRQAVYRKNTGISSRGTGRFVQLMPSCFVHIVNICLDIMPSEYMKRTML